MRFEDALFNWLQIKVVADARADDRAAQDTAQFFYEILVEDHKLTDIAVAEHGEGMLRMTYRQDGEPGHKTFDRELVEQLLHDINMNPKYNE